ncbi:MAG: hypothetical protein KDD64_12220, partial [Bdellovibrionales bacterium]|nr:hypothetical protein [Bdellovibrionales bacterium]
MVSHVTFLTATKLHADLALAIETRLRNEQVSSTFLTCDNHYHQRAGETLVAAQKTPVALSTRAEVTDWPAMSRAERVPHLESARENLFRLFSSLKTDVVVVFFDRGDLEQLTLRAAERFGIRTVCIQDGLLGLSRAQWENSESPTPKIYPASPGEGGADQFLIWGENFKRDLESVGICSQVEVVGSLRHDRLAQIANFRVKGPPYVIVLSGQPFSTFGFMFTSQEIALYERVARQLLARPDTKVIFRPHPESDLKDFYYKLPATFGDRLSVDIDSDLFDLLSQADGLVTVSSTVAVESAALGIPTARLPHLIGVVQRDTFLLENGKFEAKINAKDFPASLTFGIDGEDLQSYGGKYLGTLDGRSLERTCSSILGQSKSKDPVGYQASVTALIESVGDDPTATIHSLLRQRISELNVVVYDRSPNQSLVQRLPKLFSDPRVTVKPAPGQRSGPALNAGLEGSTSEYILRIYPGT